MGLLAASHPRATKIPASSIEAGGERVLSLIERRTALLILGFAAVAFVAVWLVESAMGALEPHDRWAEPMLAAVMGGLFLLLWRSPARLLLAQRAAVGAVVGYFVLNAASMLLSSKPFNPFWVAGLLLWMPTLFLMLFATWSARWAVILSLGLFCVVASPVLFAGSAGIDATDRAELWALLFNGVVAQALFLFGLASLSRLHRGLNELVDAADAAESQDARQAVETWVEQRTAELARAKDSAEAASRAKSRFLAVMSHELRTPLHAVLASAELLRDRRLAAPVDGEAARDQALIETIRRSGSHLLTLIDEVLELSRIEAGKLEMVTQPFELRDVAEQALQAVRQQAYDKGLKLSCQLAQPLAGTRRGDALRVTQVLINLLANAVKFTERGEVELRVEGTDDSSVRFIVRDTGPGLSPEQQSRVFDAFHQVDSRSTRQHGGAGLGLTITRELVHLMSGQLSLKSEVGVGTEIAVTLPLAALLGVTQMPAPVARTTPLPLRLEGVRVLVVEDDPVNSMLAIEMLASAGATVEAVESGPGALAWLREYSADVVLMDWRMPGMDGLEVTRRMRQGQAGTAALSVPVIGLTANAFAEDREACLAAGMNHVLTKPIDRQRLVQDVRRMATKPGHEHEHAAQPLPPGPGIAANI
ncbi:MAG: response regulator [Aquabacterium sp.]|nr:MAG: response regulator [Aquabacterium sp.]